MNARSARSKDSQQEKKKRQSRSALERFPNRNNHLSSATDNVVTSVTG
jgi:hypothetical protein